mmetsp:Transcript_32088/g.85475  ORF Transcript_32088/g.85475 Transcript_32088/m.85475 type:complete len:207 (+) Transcript_32088:169-789(+)
MQRIITAQSPHSVSACNSALVGGGGCFALKTSKKPSNKSKTCAWSVTKNKQLNTSDKPTPAIDNACSNASNPSVPFVSRARCPATNAKRRATTTSLLWCSMPPLLLPPPPAPLAGTAATQRSATALPTSNPAWRTVNTGPRAPVPDPRARRSSGASRRTSCRKAVHSATPCRPEAPALRTRCSSECSATSRVPEDSKCNKPRALTP